MADAIKGDAATVNNWVASTKANDPELVFVGEGLLSITSILDPAKMQFGYKDFAFVENLYSSIFVLPADSGLNIGSIPQLEAYVKESKEISVAVNGATGSEAFLAAALIGAMGAGDQLKLVAYSSSAEAAQAVAKGETQFAVSHQSQILETYQQGGVTIVGAFDEKAIENGPFAGVEGVGQYGYPYFRNRCFVMARAGTDAAKVAELKELYGKILADETVNLQVELKALAILAILVVSFLLSQATGLFVVGAVFCSLGFMVYFRCKKPSYYAITLVAAVAIWAAFRFILGVDF